MFVCPLVHYLLAISDLGPTFFVKGSFSNIIGPNSNTSARNKHLADIWVAVKLNSDK